MKALQYVYGKLTKSPEGPILKGEDHACTGATEDFPEMVRQACQPVKIGPGINDLTPWHDYAWKDGGFAFQVVFDEGKPWVVACKVRGRSESGENKPGRIYQQAHYLTLPASELSRSGLFDIWMTCDPVPMQGKDMHLPFKEVSDTDFPLPEGWLEKDAPFIRALMSGQSIRLQQAKVEIESVMQRFQRILCALPEDLAWRIGVRIGAWEMRDEVALAHGQRAMSGIRFIGKNLKGDQGVDYSMGDRYLNFLADKCGDAKTHTELLRMVGDKSSVKTTFGSFDPTQSWSELALEIGQRMLEQDSLQAMREVMSGSGDLPSPDIFYFYRYEALELAIPELDGRGSSFLQGCLSEVWADAWASFQQESMGRTLGLALGQIDILNASDMGLIAGCWLPETLQKIACMALNERLEKDFGGPISLAHIWEIPFQPGHQPWFELWSKQAIYPLFWLALDFNQNQYSSLLSAGYGRHPWNLLDAVINDQPSAEQAIEELLHNRMTGANADKNSRALFYKVLVERPTTAVFLLSDTDQPQWPILTLLNGPFAHEFQYFDAICNQILNEMRTTHPLLIRLLILATAKGVLDKEKSKSILRPLIGRRANRILFDQDDVDGGDFVDVAKKAIVDAVVSGFVSPRAIMEKISQPNDILRLAVHTGFDYQRSLDPALQALIDFKGGIPQKSSSQKGVMSEDLGVDSHSLFLWVEHCPSFGDFQLPLETPPSFLLSVLPLLKTSTLSVWIEQNAPKVWMHSERWTESLLANNLAERPLWRLKMALEKEPIALIKPSSSELNVIESLPLRTKAYLILAGVEMPQHIYLDFLSTQQILAPQTLSQAKALCAATLQLNDDDVNRLIIIAFSRLVLKWSPDGETILKEKESIGFFSNLWKGAVGIVSDKSDAIWSSENPDRLCSNYLDALPSAVLEALKA